MNQAPEQNQSHDGFNTLLDHSLATYASNKPRFGLEERIITRVSSDTASSHPSILTRNPARIWLSALAAVAIAVVSMLYTHLKHQSQQFSQANFAKIQPYPRPETHIELHQPKTLRAVPLSRARPQSPKTADQISPQPVFGQTQPTRDDLLMAEFVSRSPSSAAALARTPVSSTTPVSVSSIPNQPIAMPAIQMNEITVAPIEVAEIH